MNQELLILKGHVSDLPEEDQSQIKKYAQELRLMIEKDKDRALLAVAMVSLEQA